MNILYRNYVYEASVPEEFRNVIKDKNKSLKQNTNKSFTSEIDLYKNILQKALYHSTTI